MNPPGQWRRLPAVHERGRCWAGGVGGRHALPARAKCHCFSCFGTRRKINSPVFCALGPGLGEKTLKFRAWTRLKLARTPTALAQPERPRRERGFLGSIALGLFRKLKASSAPPLFICTCRSVLGKTRF